MKSQNSFEKVVKSLSDTVNPRTDDFVSWMLSVQSVSPDAFQRIASLALFLNDPRFASYRDGENGVHWIARKVLAEIPVVNGAIDADLFFETCGFFIELEKSLAVRDWQKTPTQGVHA